MSIYTTTRCRAFAHPEVSFEVSDDVPVEQIDSLVSMLEAMVASGSVFSPDQTMQYGWSILQFQSDKKGGLVLMEPDLSTRPIQFHKGLTETLVHNMRQVYTGDSYGIDREQLDFPHIGQSVIACRNFAIAEKIHLGRLEKNGPNDSGWFFGCYKMPCDHNSAAHIINMSLLDAVAQRPETLNWLALPSGQNVLLHPSEKPIVFTENDDLNLIPGSFVDALFNGVV